ncbi:MAG: hypothetical protein J5885_02575 [Clostridia bacterium]|nr:hypothetical protein [Clostridia bacterium]
MHLVDTKYYFADTTGYTFSDAGATYYLQGTTEGNITHSTESGTVWLQNGNTYYIETVSGQATSSTKYYLGADAYGRVTCTTTSTNWTLNGSSLYTGSQYLVHVNGANGGWGLTDNRAIIQISNGTNYLGSSGTSAVTAGNAAEWLNTNGYLHTVVNNTHYYLNRSDTTVSITTTPSTQWSVSSSGITDGSYSLVCDGGTWKAEKTGIYITDGTNYLSIVNNNAIGNRTSTSNATVWMLAANGTGYRIYATVGNTTYYLRNNGGTLTLYSGNTENNRTTWTMDSNTLSSGNYYLGYNGGWTLQQDSGEFYLYDGTRYLYYNNSSTPAATNTRASATTWIQNGNYFSPASRTTYYLNNTRSGNWNYTYTPNISNSTDYRYQLDNSNRLYFSGNNFWSTTSYYLYYSSGWKTTTTAGSASTFQKISAFEAPVLQFVSAGTPLSNEDQSFAGIARTSAAAKYYTSETLPDYVDYTQGYATYLPLNTDPEDSTLARNSNTGYIVGGSYDPTTTSTYPDRAGDIRISYYSISGNINNSYSDGVLKTDEIYTINGTGEHPIANIGTEKFKKYSASSSDFLSILAKDNTYVYGMHFMNAQISKNQLIKASKVTINGDSYTNYEMPAASIDFNLAHKGYINFFAGTYFTGNNSFFSLHRIFRDNSHNITDIKEIEEIWGVDGDENLFYAYVYSGETGETIALSDGSRTFDNISALLEYDSRYTCLFETEWIKTNALKQNYIYYFEIPADSGEYALGSVDGGTGAYLLYLDISANSGDVDRSVMDYLKGVDFVTSNDPETAEALLTAIADNNPTAAFALKDAFSGNVSKVTFTRTEAGDTITITVTGNADPSDYMRKYYIPLDDKTIEINFVASS